MEAGKSGKRIRRGLLLGFISAVIIFLLFYLGVNNLLQNEVLPPNLLAFGVIALVLGGLIVLFHNFQLYVALGLFCLGLTAGFWQMLSAFAAESNGWGDIAGLLSFFVLAGGGLFCGVLLQLIWSLSKRKRKKVSPR